MNAAKLLNTRAAMIAVGAVVVAGIAYFAVKKFANVAGDIADNYNSGTPYSSDDLNPVQTSVATLAHATDDLSGNTLSRLGSWLGGTLYDIFHPNEGEGLWTPDP